MKPRSNKHSLPASAITSVVLAFSSVHVAAISWNGGDGSWDDTANWTPNTLPSSADTAVFGGSAGTVTATNPQSVFGLQFGASGYTLAGAALTLGTGGIDAASLSSGTTTIGNSIIPAAGVQYWNSGAECTLAASGFPTQFGPAGGIVIFSKTGTITTTAANGWDWRAGGPGLIGPGMVIDNGDNTYDWAYKGAGNAIMAPSYVAAGTGDKNNVKITGNTTLSLNASWASILVSGATFTANGANLYVDTGIILQNGGTINGGAPLKSNNDGLYIYTPGTGGTIASSIQNNGANVKNLYKAGPGTLTLSGNDTYTGSTHIFAGSLNLTGTGAINSSSGVIVNGNGAKYVHTSSVASNRTVTLTQGTVDGSGTLATVNVANLAGNTITNGNGSNGTLTIGTLAFAGASTINVNQSGATKGLAVTTLTTPNTGSGEIMLNATNNTAWNNGATYDLITFTTLTGSLADFTKGTIVGISGRQNATLGNSGTAITLTVSGDNPVWTGVGSQTWTTAPTNDNTGPNAWALKTGHTATNFWANDAVEFKDTYNLGSGDTAVTNSTVTISGGVAPVGTTFSNSAVNYIVNSGDSTGITAGTLSKSGTGTVTLNAVNSYAGGTTINAGTLTIGGSGSLGSGSYAGAIANSGTFQYNSAATQILSGAISGAGAINVTGSGVLTLSGSNTFSGQLTVSNGGTVKVATVNNANTNGNLGNSSLPVILGNSGTNGTLEYTGGTGSVTTNKTFSLATGGTGTIQVDNAGAELKLSAANGLSGDGQLIKTGPGTLAMGDAGHNYSGGTVITNGLLQGGNTLATASFGTGPITLGLQGSADSAAVGLGNGGVVAANNVVVASGTGARSIYGGSGANETFSGAITLGDGGGAGNLHLATLYAGSASSKLILSNTISGVGNIQMYANNIYNSAGSHDVTLSGPQDQAGTISSIDSPTTPAYATHGVNTISGPLGAGITNVTQNSLNSTLVLSGFNVDFTGTVTVSNGTLKLGGFSALNSSNQVSVAATGTFDLNGNDVTIGGLSGTGYVTNSGAFGTLMISGGTSNSFDGDIGGNTALTMNLSGGATQTLTGSNFYTGDTTVEAGVLAVDGDAIPDFNKLVINGGKVNPMGNTEVVDRLFFGTEQQASGTYGATGSGATHIDDAHFTGTGVLSVISDPPARYAGWADLYAPGQTMDQDHDHDGVANGIEYFMGETGSTFTTNPAPEGGTVTWPMGFDYAGVYGTDYEVQYSTDLIVWTKVNEGTGANTATITPGNSVVYHMPTGGRSFVRLVVRN